MAAGIPTCPVGDLLQEDYERFRAQEQCSLKCATMFTAHRLGVKYSMSRLRHAYGSRVRVKESQSPST